MKTFIDVEKQEVSSRYDSIDSVISGSVRSRYGQDSTYVNGRSAMLMHNKYIQDKSEISRTIFERIDSITQSNRSRRNRALGEISPSKICINPPTNIRADEPKTLYHVRWVCKGSGATKNETSEIEVSKMNA